MHLFLSVYSDLKIVINILAFWFLDFKVVKIEYT